MAAVASSGQWTQKRVLIRTATVNGTRAHTPTQVPRAHTCVTKELMTLSELKLTPPGQLAGQSMLVHRLADKAPRPGRNVPLQSGREEEEKIEC